MKVIFVDSNLFLQCKAIESLPWADVATEEDLLILIPRAVLVEIDRHKCDGNTRRAKRARLASSVFRKVIASDDITEEVRKSEPHVILSFSPQSNEFQKISNTLDSSKPDDQIINEVLAYKASHPDMIVELLTHDTNLMLTAKHFNIVYRVIPDNWLLPPEPDHRDKRIGELENKINELIRTYPLIEVAAQDSNEHLIESLTSSITVYENLTEQMLSELISEAKERNPLTTSFDASSSKGSNYFTTHNLLRMPLYKPPSDSEIKEYKEKTYPAWVESVRDYFVKLPNRLDFPERCLSFSFIITNIGTIPAENIVIEFEALGGLLFMPMRNKDNDNKGKKENEFPQPPEIPKGTWSHALSAFDSYNRSMTMGRAMMIESPLSSLRPPSLPKPRDRNTFYWKDDKPTGTAKIWNFECQEFMHKANPERFDLNIFVPKDNISSGAIRCRVHAKNLPNPVVYTLPVNVEYKKRETIDIAQRILRESLPKISISTGKSVHLG